MQETWTLLVKKGTHKGMSHVLNPPRIIIGREVGNDIVLSDSNSSRRHVRLEERDGRWHLIDLGSMNGTFLNGDRLISDHVLEEGDEFRIGETSFVFTRDTGSVKRVDSPKVIKRREALYRFEVAARNQPNWDSLILLLCQAVTDLLESEPTVIALNRSSTGTYYGIGPKDQTLPDLPDPKYIEEACESEEALTLDGGPPYYTIIPLGRELPVPVIGFLLAGQKEDSRDEGIEVVMSHLQCLFRASLMRPDQIWNYTSLDLTALDEIQGESEAMVRVREEIAKAAMAEVPVMILGESGTGKDLVAQAIHRYGLRSEEPFVAINCASIAPGLLDSELFGHEKGSFTGAHQRHEGIFEQAGNGTVFLDEVGDLTDEAQAKLLRVLDHRIFRRVGGTEDIRTPARVIAATNKDLTSDVAYGGFRLDLFYRLAGYVISLLPLRERVEDIALLFRHFLMEYAAKGDHRLPTLTAKAITKLNRYPWPGNVRELQMAAQRTLIEATGGKIEAADLYLKETQVATGTPKTANKKTLSEIERDHILATLDECGGNKKETARILGISRKTLYAKLKTYDSEE